MNIPDFPSPVPSAPSCATFPQGSTARPPRAYQSGLCYEAPDHRTRRLIMDLRTGQALRDALKDKTLLKDKCYIDGRWVRGEAAIEVTNPVNGEVICTVPKLGRKETAQAIEAAEKAQKSWAARTAKERAKILRKWQELMLEHQ